MGLSVKIYIILFIAVFSLMLFQGQRHYVAAGGIELGDSPEIKTDSRNYSGEVILKEGDESLFSHFVTPGKDVVRELAAGLDDPEEVYYTAVRWIYVSEETLNGVPDKWLTPEEFLTGTPDYPNNPVKGKVVSDCEEKANTLVSMIRVLGVSPDDVRVAAGKVLFDNKKVGHVWAELSIDGKWLVLDPTCGPYWDDNKARLVDRVGLPFDYYSGNDFPVIQVWTYYNDAYCLDLKDGSGDAPESWGDVGIDFPPFAKGE
jgi:hypothetical protein